MNINQDILTTPHNAGLIQIYLITGNETFLKELRIK
jgi:DNA polymerase III delta subunit